MVQWVPTDQSSVTLTLTGDIAIKGSHGKNETYQSTNINSDELHFEGTLKRKGFHNMDVKETCPVQINWQAQNGQQTIGGILCGRTVSTHFPKSEY